MAQAEKIANLRKWIAEAREDEPKFRVPHPEIAEYLREEIGEMEGDLECALAGHKIP